MFHKPICDCAPDCDHWEYKPALPPRQQQSDECSYEGSEDGDLY